MSPEIKYQWLNSLTWVAKDCQGAMPRKFAWPRLQARDVRMAQNNVALVDLPFARARHFLYFLERFNIMRVQDTREFVAYAMLQFELYCWKVK